MTNTRPQTIAAVRRMNQAMFDEVYAGAVAAADVLEGMGAVRADYAQRLITDAESTLTRDRANTNGLGYWESDTERRERNHTMTFASMAAGMFLLGQPNGVN